jgi:acetyl esterase/lipase
MNASNPSEPTDPPTPDLQVPYKQVEGTTLRLDVFLADDVDAPPDHTAARPIVLWFHGGGWNGGSPEQFYRQSAYLSQRGLVCISAEYRLKRKHGTTPFDAIRDAFDAMRYVRDHASEWGGDPGRIAAGGGSAGGHLAAALATLTAEDLAGSPTEAAKARPDMLMLYNPVFDNGPVGGWGHERLGETWREASPAHNIRADVPPTLVMLGDEDKLLPVETVERFTAQLDEHGIANRVIVYPGVGHAFFNFAQHDGEYYHKTLAAVEAFLVQQGWLVAAPANASDRAD